MTTEYTFGNPAFDEAYDNWRLACPYDDDVDYKEPDHEEGGLTMETEIINKASIERLFRDALYKRADVLFESNNALKETKVAIKRFLASYAHECTAVVMGEYGVIVEELGKVSNLEEKISDLKIEIEKLRRQKEAELQITDDPKMLTALRVYRVLTKEDIREDSYTRQRRITAAGAICGAYLGLQSFLGAPTKKED